MFARSFALRVTLLTLIGSLCLSVGAGAGRIMRYDRSTGEIDQLYSTYQHVEWLLMNSASAAIAQTDGIYLVDLATGAPTRISDDAAQQGYGESINENYIMWRLPSPGSCGKVMNLATGTVTNTDADAYLAGEYAVYGTESEYTAQRLDTGELHTITVPDGRWLYGATDTTIVVCDYATTTYYNPPYGPPQTSYVRGMVEYDIETGQPTGWSCRYNSSFWGPRVLASDDWFLIPHESPETLRLLTLKCARDGEHHDISASSCTRGIWGALWGDTAAKCDETALDFWSLSTDEHETMLLDDPGPPEHRSRYYALNGDYFVWRDDLVPEPSSLMALSGLLGIGLLRLRRR